MSQDFRGTLDETLALFRRCAATLPASAGVCEELIHLTLEDSEHAPSMPPETGFDREPSVIGWYYRPHPDALLARTEIVLTCARCTPPFRGIAYRTGRWRPAWPGLIGPADRCAKCGRSSSPPAAANGHANGSARA